MSINAYLDVLVGLGVSWGIMGCPVVLRLTGDDEQNSMQVKFSSYGQIGDLEVRSKGQISLNFGYHVNFSNFYTRFFL